MKDERDRAALTENVATMEKLLNPSKDEEEMDKAKEESGAIELADFQIVDAHLQSEVLNMVGGLFEPGVCFNMPRTTNQGKMSWPACKRMPNNYCKYEGKEKHVHIVDVGIHGARIAAQAYGGLRYGPLGMPTVMEIGGTNYWVVEVQCIDTIRNVEVTHWQFQEYLQKWGYGANATYKPLEYGAQIVQSKGLRKVILSVVPPQLRRLWIKDYIAGKDAFDPARILELQGGRLGLQAGKTAASLPPSTSRGKATSSDKPPPKKGKKKASEESEKKAKTTPSNGDRTLATLIPIVAKMLGTTDDRLSQYTASSMTNAKATLTLAKVQDDQLLFANLKKKFESWDVKAADESAGEDIEC